MTLPMVVGEHTVSQMELSLEKIKLLWTEVSRFRMLFSDLTVGNADNFVQFVTQPYSMFFEVSKDDRLEGVVCFTGMDAIIDVDGHVMFFDSKPGGLVEKLPVMRAIGEYMFDNFPIHRITVTTPKVFFATVRLIKRMGLVEEGCKRQATIINGKWLDLLIHGITREEWYVGTSRRDEDAGTSPKRRSGV